MPFSHAKMRLKSPPQKLKFLIAKGRQKHYTLNCSHKCPCTFLHSYALLHRFREKPFYIKLTTFSTAQGTKNETKPIVDLKSTSKVNMRSRWRVFHPWKRDYTISEKLQTPQNSSRPFLRALIKLYQVHIIWRPQRSPSIC